MRIPDLKVKEIYAACDILDIVKDYVKDLKKNGNHWKGSSPFQQEKTPSFCVWPNTQSYKCFSSGKGGKVAQFLIEMEGYSYGQALEHLAKKYNIVIERKPLSEAEAVKYKRLEQYKLINEAAVSFYHQQLKTTAHPYLKDRGLSEETIQKFQLGYAPDEWTRFTEFAISQQFGSEALTTLGLCKERKDGQLFDRFRDRIIFPITDIMGNTMGFSSRTLDPEVAKKYGKYVNSSDSELFKKSELLYGIAQAKVAIGQEDLAILVEGQMDVLMLNEHGIENTVASSGTSLTIEQIKLIKRFTNHVLFIYDGDKAGIKATWRGINILLKEGMEAYCLLLPDGKDPDEYIKKVGKEGFLNYVAKHKTNWLQYKIQTSGKDLKEPAEKSTLIRHLVKCIELIPDEIAQATYLQHIQEIFNIQISLNGQEKRAVLATTSNHKETKKEDTHHQQTTERKPYQLQLKSKREWGEVQKLFNYLSIPSSPDFEKNNQGYIDIHYKEISGKAYRITTKNSGKSNAIRNTSVNTPVNAVYIPQALRTENDWQTKTLLIVLDEITAHILCEFGIPAVGINNPMGFLSRPNQKTPHKLINQVIKAHEFTNFIYALDHKAFRLPPVGNDSQPYINKDAAANADYALKTLIVLKETFSRMPGYFIYGDLHGAFTDMQRPHWIDRLVMRLRAEIPFHWMGEILREELYAPDPDVKMILKAGVDTGTPYSFREALRTNEVSKFVELHGIEKLGKEFQFGSNIYQHNPIDGSVTVASAADDAYTVVAKHGRYYGRSRDGEQAISDFEMNYELEIKQENSLYLIAFKPITGPASYEVISAKEFLSADSFKQRVMDIQGGKFNFWGSKSQLEQIHAMNRRGVKEARSLDNTLGFSKKYGIYVFGNGIIDSKGNFHEIDENGVVNVEEKRFFLPAFASFNEESRDYKAEREFVYYETGIKFGEWAEKMIQVHKAVAHLSMTFMIACLYRDLYQKTIGKFNHLFIQAPPSAGKTSFINHVCSFFGHIMPTNLQTRITSAAFERKMELITNGVMVINEFNLSDPNVQNLSLPKYLKGTYDFEGGEKTINNKSRQVMPSSGFFIIGQETFWHQEALVKRCVIIEKDPKKKWNEEETMLFDELDEMCKEGISGLNSIFFTARPLIEIQLKKEVRRLQGIFQKRLNNSLIENRQLENWAMTLAPICILIREKKITYPLTEEQIIKHAVLQIADQSQKMIADGVLSIFFNFIESEYGPRKLLDHQDIWLYPKKNQLRIRINSTYKHFLSYIRRENMGIENTSKNDVIARLLEHPACEQRKKKDLLTGIQVGYAKDAEGRISTKGEHHTPVPAISGAQVITFNYDDMPDFTLPSIAWTNEDYIDPSPDTIPNKAVNQVTKEVSAPYVAIASEQEPSTPF